MCGCVTPNIDHYHTIVGLEFARLVGVWPNSNDSDERYITMQPFLTEKENKKQILQCKQKL